MSERERYKQTKRLKTVYKNKVQIHFRPSDRTLQQLELYKVRTDFQGNYQALITRIISEITERMTFDEFFKDEPDLIHKLRREKDKQKWVDLIIDENLTEIEIDVIKGSAELIKERIKREI